jgi:hypothetical protein
MDRHPTTQLYGCLSRNCAGGDSGNAWVLHQRSFLITNRLNKNQALGDVAERTARYE